MEERFDDSSKQSEAQAAVKWIAFLARTGVGWSGVDRAKKAKIFFAIAKRAGRHQAVLSFCQKGYVRVCPVLIAGFCTSHNTPVTRSIRAYYEHEKLET